MDIQYPLGIEKLPARKWTTTEEADIVASGTHFCVEETYAVHPTEDQIEPIGDNLYRLVRFDQQVGDQFAVAVSNSLSMLLDIYR